MIFGMIIGIPFALYTFDPENATALLANWLGAKWHADADMIARLLFGLAALVLAAAAMTRTWASSYLNAGVVYASEVKSASLVAGGPYRRVRNPLYFANVLMAVAMGTMMSRSGFVLTVAAMIVFCYRLIFREEAELLAGQGTGYAAYTKAVQRLWPALLPRVPDDGRKPAWSEGFRAEAWYWGFAAALAAFAITLKLAVFFIVTAASVAFFWWSSTVRARKQT
jgi:protein-S-isoprenylcysteine O-methyltransferase Ste14